jgi:hypothetical protein
VIDPFEVFLDMRSERRGYLNVSPCVFEFLEIASPIDTAISDLAVVL